MKQESGGAGERTVTSRVGSIGAALAWVTLTGGAALFFLLFSWRLTAAAELPHQMLSGAIALLGCVFLVLLAGPWVWARRLEALHDRVVEASAEVMDQVLSRRALLWNAVFAAIALFTEMAIIRWVTMLLPHLSTYRNFALLACFLGLGTGMMLGRRRLHWIPYTAPMIGLHLLQSSLIAYHSSGPSTQLEALFWSPLWQFMIIVVATIGPGQLVGRMLSHRSDLGGYGANLLGSLAGVAAIYLLSALWTSPVLWVLVAGLALLVALGRSRVGIAGFVALALITGVAHVSTRTTAQLSEVHSPYQRLTLLTGGQGSGFGSELITIFANGGYFTAFSAVERAKLRPNDHDIHAWAEGSLGPVRDRLKGARTLVLGSGAGNNLPPLLRAGVSELVAVEIDPGIAQLGVSHNADRPYLDSRVTLHINDARAYLRSSEEKFDVVIMQWIDSYPGATLSTGLRSDSFVYTLEAFEDCRARLAPGGTLLIYAYMHPLAAKRIATALQRAFPAATPHTFRVNPDPNAWLFVVGPADPTGGSPWVSPAQLPEGEVRLLTDDWPFVYLILEHSPLRIYLPFLVMVLLLSGFASTLALSGAPRVEKEERDGALTLVIFFLFGAGFMLLETTSIMRVSLLFGLTWQVIGLVIAAVLVMAFIGNLLVARSRRVFAIPWMLGLTAALVASWLLAPRQMEGLVTSGGIAGLLTLVLVSSPLIFSGVLFSSVLRHTRQVDRALGANLMGAMLGGGLEYVGMVTGIRALTPMVLACYLVAMAAWWLRERGR